jgi:hypothetical protein
MKFYRFYLEYPDPKAKRKGTVKSPGNHSGNVLALCLDENNRPMYCGDLTMECISAVYFVRNSAVCTTSCSPDYLRLNCRRIPEMMARKIHPALFTVLDAPEP